MPRRSSCWARLGPTPLRNCAGWSSGEPTSGRGIYTESSEATERAQSTLSGSQDLTREVRWVERRDVIDAFASANQLHRKVELLLERDHDAALGRAVELGQHDAGQW